MALAWLLKGGRQWLTLALAWLLKGGGQRLLLLKGGAVVWCCNNEHRFSAYLLLLENNDGDAT